MNANTHINFNVNLNMNITNLNMNKMQMSPNKTNTIITKQSLSIKNKIQGNSGSILKKKRKRFNLYNNRNIYKLLLTKN